MPTGTWQDFFEGIGGLLAAAGPWFAVTVVGAILVWKFLDALKAKWTRR